MRDDVDDGKSLVSVGLPSLMDQTYKATQVAIFAGLSAVQRTPSRVTCGLRLRFQWPLVRLLDDPLVEDAHRTHHQ
jgi:hypothetical protein